MQVRRIPDHRAGLGGSAFPDPDQFAQVGNNSDEHVGVDPAADLLGDRRPRWEIVRHGPPLESGPGDETQAIEELAQAVRALRGIVSPEGEVRCEKRPFLVGDIGGVGGAGCRPFSGMDTTPHSQSA